MFTSDFTLRIVNMEESELILGGDRDGGLPNFTGCMQNFAIQFRYAVMVG